MYFCSYVLLPFKICLSQRKNQVHAVTVWVQIYSKYIAPFAVRRCRRVCQCLSVRCRHRRHTADRYADFVCYRVNSHLSEGEKKYAKRTREALAPVRLHDPVSVLFAVKIVTGRQNTKTKTKNKFRLPCHASRA